MDRRRFENQPWLIEMNFEHSPLVSTLCCGRLGSFWMVFSSPQPILLPYDNPLVVFKCLSSNQCQLDVRSSDRQIVQSSHSLIFQRSIPSTTYTTLNQNEKKRYSVPYTRSFFLQSISLQQTRSVRLRKGMALIRPCRYIHAPLYSAPISLLHLRLQISLFCVRRWRCSMDPSRNPQEFICQTTPLPSFMIHPTLL